MVRVAVQDLDTLKAPAGAPAGAASPVLPRGCGPAAIIFGVIRWALLVAGLALVPTACGSGSKTATTPPPARSATPSAMPSEPAVRA